MPISRPEISSKFDIGRAAMASPIRSRTSRWRISNARKTIPIVKERSVILPISKIANWGPESPAEGETYEANMCERDKNSHTQALQSIAITAITHVRAKRRQDRISAHAVDQNRETFMYLHP